MSSLGGKLKGVYYGWWVLASTFLLGAISDGVFLHSFAIFFSPMRRELGLSSTQASVIFGLSRASPALSAPTVGPLLDRFGARPVIIVGGIIAGLGFVLLHWADSYLTVLLIFVGLVALGRSAGLFQALIGAVNTWFIGRRSLAISILETGFATGAAVMLPLVTLGVHSIGWRDVMLYSGLLATGLVIPLGLVVRRSPESMGIQPEGADRVVRKDRGRDESPRAQVPVFDFTAREALRTSSYWMMLAAAVLKVTLTVAITVHAVEIMVWEGMDDQTAGFMLALIFFFAIPLRLIMGVLGMRFAAQPLMFSGSAGGVLAMLSLLLFDGNLAVYLFVIFMAIFRGAVPIQWSAMGDFFGRRSFSTLFGIMQLFMNIGTLISPIYVGWVFDRTDSYTWALIPFATLYALSGFFYLTVRRPVLPQREHEVKAG